MEASRSLPWHLHLKALGWQRCKDLEELHLVRMKDIGVDGSVICLDVLLCHMVIHIWISVCLGLPEQKGVVACDWQVAQSLWIGQT